MATRNPGPLLTSKFRGILRFIPDRFLAAFGYTTVRQARSNETEPAQITGTTVASSVTAERQDEITYETTTLGTTGYPVTLPQTYAVDAKLTREFGGGVVNITHRLAEGTQEPDEGLLVLDSQVEDIADGELSDRITQTVEGTEWPVLFGTTTDEVTGVAVDTSRQAVAAGTLGGLVTVAARSISSITAANPCVLTFATPHYCFTGDSVTIAGVTGGTTNINGTRVVTVTGANTLTLNGVNCTVAGTGGTLTNQNATPLYVEVQPADKWVSIRLCSRLRTDDVLGEDGAVTYDGTATFEGLREIEPQTLTYGGTEYTPTDGVTGVISGNEADFGAFYNDTPGSRGEWPAKITEIYFTKTQLDAWTPPVPVRKGAGGSKTRGYVQANTSPDIARVWTLRIPLSEEWTADTGTEYPDGSGFTAVSLQVTRSRLGLYKVVIVSIDLGFTYP